MFSDIRSIGMGGSNDLSALERGGIGNRETLNAKSKRALVAFIVSGVAGVVIVALGAMQIFWPIGSVGSVAFITGGGAAIFIAAGGLIWIAVTNCKKQDSDGSPGLQEKESRKKSPVDVHESNAPASPSYLPEEVGTRVEKTVISSYLLTLPPDIILHILDFLYFKDLIIVGQADHQCDQLAQSAILERGKNYGYKGSLSLEAKEHVKQLFLEIGLLGKYVYQENPSRSKYASEMRLLNWRWKSAHAVFDSYNKFGTDVVSFPRCTKYLLKLAQEGSFAYRSLKDASPTKALMSAVEMSAKDAVRLLLLMGADANAPSNNGSRPLDWAALHGCNELIELLLANGARINEQWVGGSTALCFALGPFAKSGDKLKETVQILLENNADPNLPAGNRNRPLHLAAKRGFDEVIGLLLDHGARINDPGFDGRTAIYCAAKLRKKNTVRLLVARGASVDPLIDLL